MIARLARKALDAFTSWRLARRVARVAPNTAALRQQIAERSRKHRNAAPLRRQLRAEVAARLAREQGGDFSERIAQ